ncbi:BgtE-5708 [Blumeria graminis f. sp. tritici]|uniref:BgtE-5708 n=2 Tax=Blumeria graminis f. sp. tritici TaxID=62690 RepID=A0A9X9QCC4_BLUGR|nr:putative secreted effector protein [Blumeria graminis f. sp. tritici 96224]VDB85858.1 BgtE-5708 [Blumeria graminis f. sp. tritici]
MKGINCILAFILDIPGTLVQRRRMVLVGEEPQKNYFTYKVPWPSSFPKPKNNKIFISHYTGSDNNQLLASYCSLYFNMPEIIGQVAYGLSAMDNSSKLRFSKKDEMYYTCKKYITHKWKEFNARGSPKAVNVGIFLVLQKNKCTTSTISRLAFEEEISVIGKHNCFAPPSNTIISGKPIVDASWRLIIEEEIHQSKAMMGKNLKNTYAIAWYQGYLHIFRRVHGNHNSWSLVTSIGKEINNGKLIYDFIVQSFNQIDVNKANLMTKELDWALLKRKTPGKYSEISLRKDYQKKILKTVLDSPGMVKIDGQIVCPKNN